MPTTTTPIIAGANSANLGAITAAMGGTTSTVFVQDPLAFNRKRSIEAVGDDEWEEQAKKRNLGNDMA